MPVIERASRSEVDFSIKEGARAPNIVATLTDDNDKILDLTGASVQFKMKVPGESTYLVDAPAVVTDAQNGEVSYNFSPSDTDTPGYHIAEFHVDYSGGTGNNFDMDEIFPSDSWLELRVSHAA